MDEKSEKFIGKGRLDFSKIDFSKLPMGKIVELCIKCNTKEEAIELLRQYEKCFKDPSIASMNLGYMFGYYDKETRDKLYSIFPVDHPIFGHKFGRGDDPSIYNAFKIGEEFGEAIIKFRCEKTKEHIKRMVDNKKN